jgi:carbamoyl-phosphate synthase large subunit
VDVDAISDGEAGGRRRDHAAHRRGGHHSGDSSCVLPPYHPDVAAKMDVIRDYTHRLAKALRVRGLMNVQYAIKDGIVYVLEVNPRASRTGAVRGEGHGRAAGEHRGEGHGGPDPGRPGPHGRAGDQRAIRQGIGLPLRQVSRATIPVLGPEMRSTGEVMGVADEFGPAFAKASFGAGIKLPVEGTAFLTVNDRDKPQLLTRGRGSRGDGLPIGGHGGHGDVLGGQRPAVRSRLQGARRVGPNAVDMMKNGEIHLVINTPLGQASYFDEKALRTTATQRGIPLITTISGGHAMVEAIRSLKAGPHDGPDLARDLSRALRRLTDPRRKAQCVESSECCVCWRPLSRREAFWPRCSGGGRSGQAVVGTPAELGSS